MITRIIKAWCKSVAWCKCNLSLFRWANARLRRLVFSGLYVVFINYQTCKIKDWKRSFFLVKRGVLFLQVADIFYHLKNSVVIAKHNAFNDYSARFQTREITYLQIIYFIQLRKTYGVIVFHFLFFGGICNIVADYMSIMEQSRKNERMGTSNLLKAAQNGLRGEPHYWAEAPCHSQTKLYGYIPFCYILT